MISWRHVTQYTHFVPHDRAEDYCRLGWCIADAFEQTPHGALVVLVRLAVPMHADRAARPRA